MVQTEPNSRTNFTSPLNSAAYLSLYDLLQVHQRLNATQCDRVSVSCGQGDEAGSSWGYAVYTHLTQPSAEALQVESPGKKWPWSHSQEVDVD